MNHKQTTMANMHAFRSWLDEGIGVVALLDHDLPQDATANATAYGTFSSAGDYSISTAAGTAAVSGGQLTLTGRTYILYSYPLATDNVILGRTYEVACAP